MKQAVEILKALSDMNRLRIVAVLSRYDELCACQITELLQVTGATVSRHLAVLQQAGLLASRKEGRWVHYRLTRPGGTAPLYEWLEGAVAGSAELQADLQFMETVVAMPRTDLCRMQRGKTCCPE